MSDPMTEWRRQFDALSQQYWKTWSSNAGPAAAPASEDLLAAWSRMASPATPDAEALVDRFSRQAQDYLSLMRTAAEGLAPGAGAGDVAKAWRDTLASASGGNPMLAALGSLTGEGARGVQQLAEGAEAWLRPMRGQMDSWLGMPAFGVAREQQERLQRLARDQAAYQAAMNRYSALLLEASEQAFARFERKLGERSEPGRKVDSARALYDLWIDAAEEAYAEIALSPRFRDVYGELINTQMRVRQGVQQQVERASGELGMPTRAELDSAHRRIHALQRELRELRQRLDALGGSAAVPPAAAAPAKARAGGTARRQPGKATTKAKPARKATASTNPRTKTSTRASTKAKVPPNAARKTSARPSRPRAAAGKSPSTKRRAGAAAPQRAATRRTRS